MIEQSAEEVAEAMEENPKKWADDYLHLLQQLHDMHEANEKLTRALLSADNYVDAQE